MTTQDEVGVLLAAIDKADLRALRSVLKSMCESSEACRTEAAQRLLLSVPTRRNKKRKSEHSPQGAEAAGKSSKKAKTVSRYEMCITCEKVFDITDNREDSCQTHDGQVYFFSSFLNPFPPPAGVLPTTGQSAFKLTLM
jgi:hypothetical protein